MNFFLLLISMLYGYSTAIEQLNNTLELGDKGSKVLSRKKRFLIFPDGSSFQLVFCTQNMGYLQVGDIVWFGNTAALAWELPTDPNIFYFLKQEDKLYGGASVKRKDDKLIVYLDEDGKVVGSQPYRKKPIVNPAFAKRSIESKEEKSELRQISIKEMHKTRQSKNVIEDLDKPSVAFHRDGRKSLYDKVEKFLGGLGWQGKECILRLLCETAKVEGKQGTFLEEIFRATFTFPKTHQVSQNHIDYDIASSTSTAECCAERYPECVNYQGVPLFKDSL